MRYNFLAKTDAKKIINHELIKQIKFKKPKLPTLTPSKSLGCWKDLQINF